MPTVKNEDLIPGAKFTGKIRSIQQFGAFVDFGAFTDGLVHVSRLSDSFVKDVGNVVSVGQEVTVKLVEVNMETGRISLTMRESDITNKPQERVDSPGTSGDKPKPARRNTPKPSQRKEVKSSKFVKGQDLDGTVKNLTRSGAFISLPEGEEGFLPASEESEDGLLNMTGGSSLQVGQEVNVRVLRVARGQVTLTMKKEEDNDFDLEVSQGVVHVATNPFVLAFRKNKDIAAFLDEREKIEIVAKEPVKPKTSVEVGQVNQTETVSGIPKVQDQDQPPSSDEELVCVSSTVVETVEDVEITPEELNVESSSSGDDEPESIESSTSQFVGEVVKPVEDPEATPKDVAVGSSSAGDDEKPESIEPNSSQSVKGVLQTVEKEAEEGSVSTADKIIEKASSTDEVEDGKSGLTSSIVPVQNEGTGATSADEIGSISSSGGQADILPPQEAKESQDFGVVENQVDNVKDELATQTSAADSEISSAIQVEDEKQVEKTKDEVEIQTSAAEAEIPSPEQVEIEKQVENTKGEVEIQTSAAAAEIPSPEQVEIEKQVENTKGEVEIQTSAAAAEIPSPEQVEIEKQVENTKGEVEIQTSAAAAEIPSPEQVEIEKQVENTKGEVEIQTSAAAAEIPSPEQVEIEKQVENTKGEVEIQTSAAAAEIPSPEQVGNTKDEVEIQTSTIQAEIPSAIQVENEKVETVPDENGTSRNSNAQGSSSSTQESVAKATISPALVKQLREETGAGMMDCKKALSETGGDIVKAQEFLRKKGLVSAEKKASRATAEGRIGSYIHDSRIGVLVEVNCETDFVSRGDIFKELVDDIAMQVAACPQVQYLVTEDVPEEIVNKEKEIEMQKEDLLSKPEQIRSKIVEGRIRKRLEELALLEQPYIKNDKLVVKDWVKQTIATIGENIKVRRFIRYNLGEGLEKKSQDFAAEVAAQTAAKTFTTPAKEQPASAEAKETVQKPPTVTVSAALVKQLREETGAGMMDCKKALSETGGDLEKAQEYLRKKGLSTADKKSSRLAAEGRIGSYIHDSRIGVLIEVNCETDFVGRSEKFKELVDDLAMQVVACPQVQFVSIEEVPESILNKEKELEMQREDLLSKPENIREKIVEGRVSKRLGELALLEQPFIKNDSVLVKDLVKQTVAALGENIKVRRFVRFTLGEATEDAKSETETSDE
ncbi:hypothetical protein MANES_03G024100v8 [Manihot esculenta]|uniref:Uncharacterized protein n=2 Tax=Manihot esculenta TaxID=3983 RepID=A0ACB7HXR5_MANES|nr:hypothetical protein MANES_03G024100v8 [Manihot esculenta]